MCPRGMSAEATHLPVGDIALWCQSQLSCGHRGQWFSPDCGRSLLPAGARVSRQCREEHPRARHPAPEGAHLPVGDIALAGSARGQIALWHNG